MCKRLLGAAALAVVLISSGSGCRIFCDRYCDRRDRCDYPPPRRAIRDDCNDPCRGYAPPPVVHYNDCR